MRGKPHQLSDVFRYASWSHDPNQCCIWQHALSDGYGQLRINGPKINAHVAAFCASRGWLPKDLGGQCVLHTCDNRACINPNHLWLGSRADNNRDRARKGRSAIGELSGRVKLTEEIVLHILQSDESAVALAAKFHVGRRQINYIRKGDSWKHVQ